MTLSGVTWHQTALAYATGIVDNNKGLQIGSKNKPTTDFKLSTNNIQGTIHKITVNTSGASDVKGTLTVTVGGTEYGTISLTNTATDYDFTSEVPTSGEIVLNYKVTEKATYIKSITIEYDDTPALPSPELSYAEATKTVDVADGVFTNSLTNPNNVSVTYSSSDEAVATVDANGKVTPLKGGTTTISAVFAGNDTYKAQTVSYELTVTELNKVYTLATIKDVITDTEGTYSLQFDNAVVSYVNGINAYIEDKNGAALFYADHAYQAGDVFNGVAVVKALDYNGTLELTSIGIDPTTGGEIPLTTVTLKELTENYANYELRRVKVVDATLTKAFSKRNATIAQGETTVGLFNKDKNIDKQFATIEANSTVDVIGYPGKYNNAIQLNVWRVEDITVKGETPSTVTFSTNAQDAEGWYYGTLYSEHAIRLPEDVSGSTVSYANGKLTYNEEYSENNVVPAGTAILVQSLEAGDYTATVVPDNTEEAPADNVLKGSATDATVSDANSYFYILTFSLENNVKTLGFFWQNDEGHSINTKAGKAYLQLPADASLSTVKGFKINGGTATGIEGIKANATAPAAVYTISGLRVNPAAGKLPKGVYVVNGKKVMVK